VPLVAETTRLLILGGTGEAAALAHRLSRMPGLAIVTSMAGRTRAPAAVPGELRVGGFGGAAGLTQYLRDKRVDLVVDATHPFAARISANAAAACAEVRVPRIMLIRPAWQPQASDRWIQVPNAAAAAAVLPDLGRRVFLSTGRQEIEAFANLPGLRFLVRLVDAPDAPLPLANHELILGRGPFAAEDEAALMQAHGIDVLVTKNSGGAATYGKIEAVRRLGLPVVMIGRPPVPAGGTVPGVDEAVAWVEARRARDEPQPEARA
jgi:precorrin-6A/cobalt-precorrin-6A reductase